MSTLDRPCNEWLERVSAHLDGEATEAEDRAIREHLDACPGCRTWAEAAETDAKRFAAAYGRAAQRVNLRPAAIDCIAASLRAPRPWQLAWRIAAIGAGGLLMAALLFPVFGTDRCRAHRASCLSNQKQIMYAMVMYLDDHDGRLPRAFGWNAYLAMYLTDDGSVLRCPTAQRKGSRGYDYAYNPTLSAKLISEFPDPRYTAVIFDADNGRVSLRHSGGANFAYLDGHVNWGRPTQTPKGWVLREGSRLIPIPFGAHAVPAGSYEVTPSGVKYTGNATPAGNRAHARALRALPFVGAVILVLLAGLVGWALGRRRPG